MTKYNYSTMATYALIALATMVLTMIPDLALASGSSADPIGANLCKIAKWFKGPTGQGIATIAVVTLGIAAFFGKVTWGLALMFGIGIFAIFGASEIISAVSSGTGCS
jgi:type IV secretory pathway VirB2 component (pilin)